MFETQDEVPNLPPHSRHGRGPTDALRRGPRPAGAQDHTACACASQTVSRGTQTAIVRGNQRRGVAATERGAVEETTCGASSIRPDAEAIDAAGVDGSLRPEQLDLAAFVRLSDQLTERS